MPGLCFFCLETLPTTLVDYAQEGVIDSSTLPVGLDPRLRGDDGLSG